MTLFEDNSQPETAAAPQPAARGGVPASGVSVRDYLRRLGPVGPLAIAAASLPLLGLVLLVANISAFAAWLRGHGEMGMVIYVAAFAAFSGLALLPTHVQALVGGWVFGATRGSAAAVAGAVGGALLGYVVARLGAGDRVTGLIDEHPKVRTVYRALLCSGGWRRLGIVTLVRLATSPFAMTNLVLAATKTPLATYSLGTLLGIAPRTIAAAWIGAGMQQLDVKQRGQFWLTVLGIAALIAVVMVINHVASRALANLPESEAGATRRGPGSME